MISDPYKVLGVSPTASEDDITKAYRQLAKKYHPDLNPGNDAAAKKMSEINAAYEQIKSGNINPTGTAGYGYGGAGGYRSAQGGAYNPFEEFFRNNGGAWTYSTGQNQGDRYASVINAINMGQYAKALQLLSAMPERNARWYYYSALSNQGVGNKVTALNHIKTAIQMDPTNYEYQRVLNQMQGNGRAYNTQRQAYSSPISSISKICFGLCLLRFCCGGTFC